jgi:hypothetical protein
LLPASCCLPPASCFLPPTPYLQPITHHQPPQFPGQTVEVLGRPLGLTHAGHILHRGLIDALRGLDDRLYPGRLLRYDPADPSQGLFLVAADKTETRVERIIKVRPSEVSLIAPALPAGTYTLEVRAAFDEDGTDIRSGKLLEALTVA